MDKKSALGLMITNTVMPQMAQLQQQGMQMQAQGVQAIMQAIQSIPQAPGLDPMLMQQIQGAIQGIQPVDIMPIVQTLQSLSEQVEILLLEDMPTEWVFDIERDSETKFITRVEARPA